MYKYYNFRLKRKIVDHSCGYCSHIWELLNSIKNKINILKSYLRPYMRRHLVHSNFSYTSTLLFNSSFPAVDLQYWQLSDLTNYDQESGLCDRHTPSQVVLLPASSAIKTEPFMCFIKIPRARSVPLTDHLQSSQAHQESIQPQQEQIPK